MVLEVSYLVCQSIGSALSLCWENLAVGECVPQRIKIIWKYKITGAVGRVLLSRVAHIT